MELKDQYKEVLKRLRATYTKTPQSFLKFDNVLELTIATVLSAQCTDKAVNKVTLVLFEKYKTAEDYMNADMIELKTIIRSTGFYNSKAKYLQGIGQKLVHEHNGEVPKDHDALMTLPGVSNKTANLVMAKGFGINIGVAVDTHVRRLAPRLGWTRETKNTSRIERDLNALINKKDYLDVNEFLILHGRALCGSKPKCNECPLNDTCPTGRNSLGKSPLPLT
ncbi:endonuclease III [Candidatus Uhrbacteria bacterium]|jgi:endonuclease III|nr:endonuclease III [Candidatus Uhrbacteria bacterium]